MERYQAICTGRFDDGFGPFPGTRDPDGCEWKGEEGTRDKADAEARAHSRKNFTQAGEGPSSGYIYHKVKVVRVN